MLLTAAAQAWQRFQQALELEKRLFAKTDPLELFSTNLAAFKSITRHVSVCDSAFRRAPWNSSNALSVPAPVKTSAAAGPAPSPLTPEIVKTNPIAPPPHPALRNPLNPRPRNAAQPLNLRPLHLTPAQLRQ